MRFTPGPKFLCSWRRQAVGRSSSTNSPAKYRGLGEILITKRSLLRKASDECTLVARAKLVIHPVKTIGNSIYLAGGILNCLLCTVGRDFGLLRCKPGSISSDLGLGCLQLSLLGLYFSLLRPGVRFSTSTEKRWQGSKVRKEHKQKQPVFSSPGFHFSAVSLPLL
jgi:hypothetical protein